LDPVAAAALRRDIATLAGSDGATVFLSTHNLHEAEELCDEVAIIDRGALVATGPPHDLAAGRDDARETLVVVGRNLTEAHAGVLRDRPDVWSAELAGATLRLALTDAGAAAAVVRALVEHGAEVDEVRRVTPSLESTFLALVGRGA